jgi:hypothetical protein
LPGFALFRLIEELLARRGQLCAVLLETIVDLLAGCLRIFTELGLVFLAETREGRAVRCAEYT